MIRFIHWPGATGRWVLTEDKRDWALHIWIREKDERFWGSRSDWYDGLYKVFGFGIFGMLAWYTGKMDNLK